MNKELNEKLKAGLLKNLNEYLPQCKESLVRNKHMHELKEVESMDLAPYMLERLAAVGRHLIEGFANRYTGGDHLIDVVECLCSTAKERRRVRPNEPDHALWDAFTVDFLNFWAGKRCMDLGLYTRDLREKEEPPPPVSYMQQIELHAGKNVLQYVATVAIPKFPGAPPDVVLWGTRYFKRLERQSKQRNGVYVPEMPDIYVECFAYASMTESPGLPRWEPPSVDKVVA